MRYKKIFAAETPNAERSKENDKVVLSLFSASLRLCGENPNLIHSYDPALDNW